MAFGSDLKKAIDEKNITAAELSRRTGIPKTTLSSIFKSDSDKIGINQFIKICDAIGCDPEQFYRDYKRRTSASSDLTKDEQHLLDLFRQLTVKEQHNIIGRAELLVEQHEEAIREDTG